MWGMNEFSNSKSFSAMPCFTQKPPEHFSEPQLLQSLEAALRVTEWGGTSDKGPSFIGIILWRALQQCLVAKPWEPAGGSLVAAWWLSPSVA